MDDFIREDALFSGGGEMGALMKTFDWAHTSVGPVDQWSHSLRVAVGILLHSRYPMFLWWGPDLLQFYNDAYRPSLGLDRHPRALGRPGREDWGEIWPVIGPLVEGVLAGGPATWSEDQLIPITRQGFLEEVYWTFSYSPVLEDDGTVGGVLVVCNETTRQVRAERRLRTLAGITSKKIEAQTTETIFARAAQMFTENAADFPFALLYSFHSENQQLHLAATAGLALETPASPRLLDLSAHSISSTDDPWDLRQVLKADAPLLIEDAATRFGLLPGGIWTSPATSAFILPIRHVGHPHPFGFLIAGISPGQPFDDSYRQFLEAVATALATALTDMHAYQEALQRTQELAELDRAKTVFFHNISHEFRTPLTLSLGPLETVLSDQIHPLREEQQAQVELAHRNILRQLKLVNTLLDFARIEAGRAEAIYQLTDLAQLTTELASAFQSAVEQAGLSLEVDCPPLPEPIAVDREMWEKIVLNLLSNAFKFTLEGTIRVALHPVEGGVALQIQDTGVGIRAADLPHLFERFYRAHASQARTQEGSGIGLALVQELVHLQAGTITVASQEGLGTSFTVFLPRGVTHLPAAYAQKAGVLTSAVMEADLYVDEALRWLPANQRSIPQEASLAIPSDPAPSIAYEGSVDERAVRILVVDDNADMRAYLERLLSPSYQVLLASEGAAALALAREDHPKVIISDVMMPGLDGFALLNVLRASPTTASIPVILLSARAGEEATLEALQEGANDYLVKPFSAREMVARVRLWVEIARLREVAEQARQHLHDLLMQAPASICVLRGPDHIFEVVNPLYYELVGERELLDKPVREALPELAGQGFYELLDQVYTTGEPFIGIEIRAELRRRGSQALEERYVNFVYQPISAVTGAIEGIMVHAVDVTEQVRARQQLQTFLGIASHELKNPLTSIKGNVEIAQRRLRAVLQQVPPGAETLRESLEGMGKMLARANQQIDFQNRLVSDLVDVTRIQEGKLELRLARADLLTTIQEAVEEQRRLAPARVIHLELPAEKSLFLLMDADRIGQVVTNYLSNALKYSEATQEVQVQVEVSASEIRVAVRDQGEGLDPEAQRHLWERFYRAPGVAVKSGTGIGLGLGLYICRTIIEEHKGGVGVESAKGQGSTFWFTLPTDTMQYE